MGITERGYARITSVEVNAARRAISTIMGKVEFALNVRVRRRDVDSLWRVEDTRDVRVGGAQVSPVCGQVLDSCGSCQLLNLQQKMKEERTFATMGRFEEVKLMVPKVTESRKSPMSCKNRGRKVSRDLIAAARGSFTSTTTLERWFPGRCDHSGLYETNNEHSPDSGYYPPKRGLTKMPTPFLLSSLCRRQILR